MSTFYRIAEIAECTGLSVHTLRYYERIGLIDPVFRQSNQHRLYNEHDLRWIEFLLRLRDTGMSIAQMLHYAELRRAGEQLESVSERRAMLEQHARHLNEELNALQRHLVVLTDKINTYAAIEMRLTSSSNKLKGDGHE